MAIFKVRVAFFRYTMFDQPLNRPPEEFNSKKSLRIFVVYPWILHIFCLEFVENAKVLITVRDSKNPEHNGASLGKDIDSAPFTLVHARSHCSPSRRKTTRGQTRLEFLVTSSFFCLVRTRLWLGKIIMSDKCRF